MVRVPPKLPIFLDSQHSCWPAGRRGIGLGEQIANYQDPPATVPALSPDGSPARRAASLCIFPSSWPWENQFSRRLGSIASNSTPSLTAAVCRTDPLIRPSDRFRQLAPTQPAKGTLLPAPHLRITPAMATAGRHHRASGCLLHAALIPIYWNLAWPVRLPLPIILVSTTGTSRFGGFGLSREGTSPVLMYRQLRGANSRS